MMFSFPDDYFQDEVRRDYLIPAYMKRIWASTLKVLYNVDKACETLGITYFADCGTLLGAVREKGIIPWDNDIDILMTRRDYDILEKNFKKVFPKSYALVGNRGTSAVLHPYIGMPRIMNSLSVSLTDEWLSENYGCPFPLGIDISILDLCPDDQSFRDTIFGLSELLLYTISSQTINPDTPDTLTKLEAVEKLTGKKLDRKKDILIQLETLYEDIVRSVRPTEAKCYVLWSNCCYHDAVDRVWKKDIFKKKRVPFETGSIIIPEGYDAVLTSYYGSDYMTPPIDRTSDHSFLDFYINGLKDFLSKNGDPSFNTLKALGIPV